MPLVDLDDHPSSPPSGIEGSARSHAHRGCLRHQTLLSLWVESTITHTHTYTHTHIYTHVSKPQKHAIGSAILTCKCCSGLMTGTGGALRNAGCTVTCTVAMPSSTPSLLVTVNLSTYMPAANYTNTHIHTLCNL